MAIIKIIILLTLFFTFSFASYQQLTIGTIDSYYNSKISKEELKALIDEIEQTLESRLQRNIFDYSSTGKPINLIYLQPTMLERKINSKIKQLERKQKKIEDMQEYFSKNKNRIEDIKTNFEKRNSLLNKRVKEFNSYVRSINKRKPRTRQELEEIKYYVNSRKKKLDSEIYKMNKERSEIKRGVNKYNQKVHQFNYEIQRYKIMNKELEAMNRGYKKIKGMTFGNKEVKIKSYFNGTKRVDEKIEKLSMNKIEIYGFDSIAELKVILAHEIMHLVGIPHIEAKSALMNPLIQKNQVKNLSLTNEDVINFQKNF